jgi:BlaI family transcriptional regulator, penicillinase repressor
MSKKSRVLTPLELRIMRVLWEDGAGSVQKVVQRLTGDHQLAY